MNVGSTAATEKLDPWCTKHFLIKATEQTVCSPLCVFMRASSLLPFVRAHQLTCRVSISGTFADARYKVLNASWFFCSAVLWQTKFLNPPPWLHPGRHHQ